MAGASALESYRQNKINADLTGMQSIISEGGATAALAALPQYRELAERDTGRQQFGLEIGYEVETGLLGANRIIAGINRNRQLISEAGKKGDIKQAIAGATQASRIEGDMASAANARMGRSSFGRSFSALSVSKLGTIEAKEQALKKEGLFTEKAYGEQLKVFGLQGRKLETMFQLQMEGLEDTREKMALDFTLKAGELQGIISMAVAQRDAAEKQKDWLGIGQELSDFVNDPVGTVTGALGI